MRQKNAITTLARRVVSLGFGSSRPDDKRCSDRHSIAYRFASVAFFAAFATSALWSGDAQAQACNIATNGSFESPNIQTEPQRAGENTAYANGYAVWRTTTYPIDGWQTVSGTVDILRYYSNMSHGAQGLDLYGTAAATFRQTFTGLVAGRQYTFSIDYSGHSAAQSAGVVQLGNGSGATPVTLATLRPAADSVSNGGTAGIPTTLPYTVTWRTYQHTFTAVDTAATIQIVNTGVYASSGTGLFIDNFTFASSGPCEGDLSITKDDGTATYTPGLDLTYDIVVRNIGTTPVTGAQITDPLPTGITSASWTCGSATGGGVCGATSGAGAINTTANLPAGASVTYRLSMAVPSTYTGSLTNTATVTPPAGMTDTDTSNNTASDTDTMESPPSSNACSPVRVLGNMTFAFNPLGVTGTIARTGNWQPNTYWTTSGGDFTITWTFGQAVPVDWIQFVVSDIGVEDYQTQPQPTVTIAFGAGSGASPADLVRREGELLYDPSTGVLTYDRPGPLRQQAVMRGNSTGTVTSITLTTNNVGVGDHINVSLFARPACLTVAKLSEGGTGSFQIDLTNVVQTDSTAVPSTALTTTTAGTPVSSPGYFSRAPGTAITLGEVVPEGWGITAAVCTDQNAGSTGNPTVISTFATPTLTIPAANVRPEADIVCRFDNGPLPTINLSKITSQIAGGPFGFTLGNTTVTAPAPVSTTAGGSAAVVDGNPGAETAFRVASLGADVTIDESSVPTDWVLNGATCANGNGALVGSLVNGRYTIPAASITTGQTYSCSFVNDPTTNLRIDKAVTPATARPGETVTYTIAVNNDGPGTGDGAVVTDPPVPGMDCTAATLSCSASGGAACPASLDVAALQGPGLVIPTFPAGSALQFGMACTVTATGQ
ncbi:hypothetical protein [Pseudoxanthomonas sp. UTMC 1351]|uniref:prealbumin-like fold domain-containing protein n=1 Tax=Pseudoxanthomonas sp. UTMC 1351 TaxID=2695853 RepID=UPI0034CDA85E